MRALGHGSEGILLLFMANILQTLKKEQKVFDFVCLSFRSFEPNIFAYYDIKICITYNTAVSERSSKISRIRLGQLFDG